MAFCDVVKLFRLVGQPTITKQKFSVKVAYSTEISSILRSINKEDPGCIDDLFIDGVAFIAGAELPADGNEISFECNLPQNSSSKFYKSFEDLLVQVPSICRGQIPDQFYVIEDDFFTQDGDKCPQKFQTLVCIVELIKSLSQLAHYHDQKASTKSLRLVFIHPDNVTRSISPTVLETDIPQHMISQLLINPQLATILASDNAAQNPHYNAEKGVFGTTITDFVSRSSSPKIAFEYLLTNWDQFTFLYHRNLSTYLSGFAFHKAKKEISDTEFKIAEQFSKVISEITGKLLSIPLSLAAVVAIIRSTNWKESLLILVGLSLASLLISKVVKNQKRQFDRIVHAKRVAFDAIEGNQTEFPRELSDEVRDMKDKLDENEDILEETLSLYQKLSWAPTYIGIGVFLLHHSSEVQKLWVIIVKFCFRIF